MDHNSEVCLWKYTLDVENRMFSLVVDIKYFEQIFRYTLAHSVILYVEYFPCLANPSLVILPFELCLDMKYDFSITFRCHLLDENAKLWKKRGAKTL